jgi:hypothetical protein
LTAETYPYLLAYLGSRICLTRRADQISDQLQPFTFADEILLSARRADATSRSSVHIHPLSIVRSFSPSSQPSQFVGESFADTSGIISGSYMFGRGIT